MAPRTKAAAEGAVLIGRRSWRYCEQRYASEAISMSDQDDWEFAGPDDAKAEIRAAVGVFAERCYRRRPR